MEMLIFGRKILPKKKSKTAAKAEQKEGAHSFSEKNAKLPPDVQRKSIAKVRFLKTPRMLLITILLQKSQKCYRAIQPANVIKKLTIKYYSSTSTPRQKAT